MSCDGELITRSFPTFDALFLASEVTVALLATLGNGIILFVFFRDLKLRRLTNYYIASLALTDLLVGVFGIPLANLTEVAVHADGDVCLLMLCTLIIIHLVCIFSLFGVTLDRYLSIVHPVFYIQVMTIQRAKGIIMACWLSGAVIGLLPLLGWSRECHQCFFLSVMAPSYLVLLYVASVFLPGLVMAVSYGRIYYMILRRRHHADGREVQATRRLSIIVLFFVVCWLPLNTCNFVTSLCSACIVPMPLLRFTVVLYHANSAINPILYAYHIQDFRDALRSLVCQTLRCGKLGAQLTEEEEGDQRQARGIDGPALFTSDQGAGEDDRPQEQDQQNYHKRDQHQHQEHEQLQGHEQGLLQKHDQPQDQHQHQNHDQLQNQHQPQKHDQLLDQYQPQKQDQLQDQHQHQKHFQMPNQQQPEKYDQLHDQHHHQTHDQMPDQQQPEIHDQLHDQHHHQKHDQMPDQQQPEKHDQLQDQQQPEKHDQLQDQQQPEKYDQLQDQPQHQKTDQLCVKNEHVVLQSLRERTQRGFYYKTFQQS